MNTPPWETQQQEGTTRLTSTREEMTVIIGALCVAPSDVRGMPISALGVPTAYPTRQSGGWWATSATFALSHLASLGPLRQGQRRFPNPFSPTLHSDQSRHGEFQEVPSKQRPLAHYLVGLRQSGPQKRPPAGKEIS